jgi:hypothetical protein
MQNIDPETIYELTPAGDDVIQHRSLQLPMELRFLLMLINGVRSVGTLRVVTPAAKHDDAGFIILSEYGLIRATNTGHSESQPKLVEVAQVEPVYPPLELTADEQRTQRMPETVVNY